MTDRIKGAWVVFDDDYREDDVQGIVDALKMIKGVTDVRLEVTTSEDYWARGRVKREVAKEIMDVYERLFK